MSANISDVFAGLARDLDEVIAARLQRTSIADIAYKIMEGKAQIVRQGRKYCKFHKMC